MPKETFQTRLVNHRKRAPSVTVVEDNGTPIIQLNPGEEFLIETEDKLATFSRWSEVVFIDAEPWTKLVVRPGWTEPSRGKWPTEFLLVGGKKDSERFQLANRSLLLQRGVPVIASLYLLDSYVIYSRVEVGRAVLKRRPSEIHDGIVEVYWSFEDNKTPRSKDEIEAIQTELDALTARADLERAVSEGKAMPEDVEFQW